MKRRKRLANQKESKRSRTMLKCFMHLPIEIITILSFLSPDIASHESIPRPTLPHKFLHQVVRGVVNPNLSPKSHSLLLRIINLA